MRKINAQKSLNKFKGDQVNPTPNLSPSTKFDPAFLSQHKEALAAAGYTPQSKSTKSKVCGNFYNNSNSQSTQQNRHATNLKVELILLAQM